MNTTKALKVLLALAALNHLVVGLAAIFVPPGDIADWVISTSYGASFDITPVTHHIVRILGAFMLFVGVMGVFAFLEPRRYRAVIYALILLFLVRAGQRIIFADEIQQNFNVSTMRLVSQTIFFLALAAALFFLRPRTDKAI